MLKSKLVRLISSLSEKEMNELKLYLSSPFYNTNPQVIKLYNFFNSVYPDFEKHDVSKVAAFKFVYPKKSFNDSSFRNLISILSNLILDFMATIEFQQKTSSRNQILLEALSNRLLKKEFNRLYKEIQNEFTKTPPRNSEQFLLQYESLRTYYHYPETDRFDLYSNHFSKTLFSLNHFFALSKLKLAIEIASRKDLLREDTPQFHFKHHIESYALSLSDEDNSQLLNIFLKLEEFYHNPSRDNIEQTVKVFKTNYDKYSGFDNKMIATVLINQMNYLYRQGFIQYLSKMHEFYQFILSNNILTYNNSLTVSDYLNIVTTASRNKKTAWAIDFIEKYQKFLPDHEHEQTIALATATVYYDQGQFDKAIEVLAPYSFRKSSLGLRFRFITIKSYVELVFQDSDNLKFVQNFVLRMEQYIKRGAQKRNKDQSTGFTNFLKIVHRILNVSIDKNKKEIANLYQLIYDQRPLIAKKWLLQKVTYLEQQLLKD